MNFYGPNMVGNYYYPCITSKEAETQEDKMAG